MKKFVRFFGGKYKMKKYDPKFTQEWEQWTSSMKQRRKEMTQLFWNRQTQIENEFLERQVKLLEEETQESIIKSREKAIRWSKHCDEALKGRQQKLQKRQKLLQEIEALNNKQSQERLKYIELLNIDSQNWITQENITQKLTEDIFMPDVIHTSQYYVRLLNDALIANLAVPYGRFDEYLDRQEVYRKNQLLVQKFDDIKECILKLTYTPGEEYTLLLNKTKIPMLVRIHNKIILLKQLLFNWKQYIDVLNARQSLFIGDKEFLKDKPLLKDLDSKIEPNPEDSDQEPQDLLFTKEVIQKKDLEQLAEEIQKPSENLLRDLEEAFETRKGKFVKLMQNILDQEFRDEALEWKGQEYWPSIILEHFQQLINEIPTRDLSLEDKWRKENISKLIESIYTIQVPNAPILLQLFYLIKPQTFSQTQFQGTFATIIIQFTLLQILFYVLSIYNLTIEVEYSIFIRTEQISYLSKNLLQYYQLNTFYFLLYLLAIKLHHLFRKL